MRLDQLTWEETQQYLQDQSALIVPVGTCEQHGKHLPLNTDTITVEHFADVLSTELGALTAPTINYGVNLPCDRSFAGTTTIAKTTLEETLRSIVSWWESQGFGPLLVLSAHGDPVHIAALKDAAAENVRMFELYEVPLEDLLEVQTGCRHACECETSLMLYLFPHLVRQERVVDFELSDAAFQPYLNHETEEQLPGDPPGSLGFPSKANREKGQAIYLRMREHLFRWAKNRMCT
ncbi:MAG: creatininase family protein [Phycisphaerales bacterium]|nr:MAG: creatininase family protein [Phycisphaerales bacterium]